MNTKNGVAVFEAGQHPRALRRTREEEAKKKTDRGAVAPEVAEVAPKAPAKKGKGKGKK